MATDSLLPMSINNTSSVEQGIDLDALLLSANLSGTDDVLTGILQNDTDFINDLFRSCDASNQLIQSPSEVSPIFQTTPTSTNSPFDHVTDTGISYDILQSSPSGSEGGYNSAEFVPSGPDNYSPNHLMSTSGWYPYDNETYTDMVTSSRDVHIDVELGDTDNVTSSSSEFKTGSVMITEEEQKLLAEEGIHLPVDMALTKAEERHLKRVRRKIKNKKSAADSRKRRKEYIDGLERRVEKSTATNMKLEKKVKTLQSENKSLLTQLRELQAFVSKYNPSKLQAGSFMMILILSFSLVIVPQFYKPHMRPSYSAFSRSRSLLGISADEFGNLLETEDGGIIGIDSQTPFPPPPWKYQSPAIKFWNMSSSRENLLVTDNNR